MGLPLIDAILSQATQHQMLTLAFEDQRWEARIDRNGERLGLLLLVRPHDESVYVRENIDFVAALAITFEKQQLLAGHPHHRHRRCLRGIDGHRPPLQGRQKCVGSVRHHGRHGAASIWTPICSPCSSRPTSPPSFIKPSRNLHLRLPKLPVSYRYGVCHAPDI